MRSPGVFILLTLLFYFIGAPRGNAASTTLNVVQSASGSLEDTLMINTITLRASTASSSNSLSQLSLVSQTIETLQPTSQLISARDLTSSSPRQDFDQSSTNSLVTTSSVTPKPSSSSVVPKPSSSVALEPSSSSGVPEPSSSSGVPEPSSSSGVPEPSSSSGVPEPSSSSGVPEPSSSSITSKPSSSSGVPEPSSSSGAPEPSSSLGMPKPSSSSITPEPSSSSTVPIPSSPTDPTTSSPETSTGIFDNLENVIAISLAAAAVIVFIVIIIIVGCLCYCCYACLQKRKRYRMNGASSNYYDKVSDAPASLMRLHRNTMGSQITDTMEMQEAQLQLGLSDATPLNNGSAPGSGPARVYYQNDRSSAVLFQNSHTIGPTEDSYDAGPHLTPKEGTLTQDSMNSRIMEVERPKKTEFLHEDIKIKELENSQEIAKKSPPPPIATVTTLSKKEASVVDLSTITMIHNEHAEDVPFTTNKARQRNYSSDFSSDLEESVDSKKRSRTKTIDLGALTSLSPPKRSADDATLQSHDKREKSVSDKPFSSMANLSYGGEADDESDDKRHWGKTPNRLKSQPIQRASSLLEELTSIGGNSRMSAIQPLLEKSQEDRSSESSENPTDVQVSKDPPPLKSILKNSGSRMSKSSINLYSNQYPYSSGSEKASYSPIRSRHMELQTEPTLEAMTRTQSNRPISYYGEHNYPMRRAPSYDMKPVSPNQRYSYYDTPASHSLTRKDRDGFWGRPLYNYYDHQSPRKETFTGY